MAIDNKKQNIAAKHGAEKIAILDQLRRIPIIQVAVEKAKVSRPMFYRLRAEDPQFKAAVEEAMKEGVLYISDLSESQLITLIKDKNWPAISFWLKAHHPAYKPKVDITARVEGPKELTTEQEALIERALKYVAKPPADDQKGEENKNNNKK